jgi:hypothetical protein
MGQLDVGNILYHGASSTCVEIILTSLSNNLIELKVLDGDHEGRILKRPLSRINEHLVNRVMVPYRLPKSSKQEFSMTPLQFVPPLIGEEVMVEEDTVTEINESVRVESFSRRVPW